MVEEDDDEEADDNDDDDEVSADFDFGTPFEEVLLDARRGFTAVLAA